MTKHPLRFTGEEADKAGDDWKFNCGPGALCAILNMTPNEIRPLLGDFEKKGYMNPTNVLEVLNRAGVSYRQTYRADAPGGWPAIQNGLMRVQFSGPWTKPGVPMRVRYNYTHWIAARDYSKEIFDINAIHDKGWITAPVWSLQLIPWLLKHVCPKNDGGFWITHAYEVTPIS